MLHVVNEHSSEAAGQQDNKEKMRKGGREGVIAAAAPWDFVCALNNHPGMKLFVSPLFLLRLLCLCWHQMDVNMKNVFFEETMQEP